jgi:hypothetical protein
VWFRHFNRQVLLQKWDAPGAIAPKSASLKYALFLAQEEIRPFRGSAA